MRMRAFVLVLCWGRVAAFGQPAGSQDIVSLYDRVPPPPASPQEGYKRCECQNLNPGYKCTSEAFYKSIEDEANTLDKVLKERLKKEDFQAAPAMQRGDAEAIKKKMASMSKEEKVKYAMEMSQQMQMGQERPVMESPAVTEAVQEYTNVTQAIGQDIQQTPEMSKQVAAREEERRKRHNEIDAWQQEEGKKIPQVSGGEMSWPEPKAYRALMIAAADKHLAVETDHLKGEAERWKKDLAASKARYGPLQKKLAAVHYGDDAKNTHNKHLLLNARQLLLNPLLSLIASSKQATNTITHWYTQKLQAEALPTR